MATIKFVSCTEDYIFEAMQLFHKISDCAIEPCGINSSALGHTILHHIVKEVNMLFVPLFPILFLKQSLIKTAIWYVVITISLPRCTLVWVGLRPYLVQE